MEGLTSYDADGNFTHWGWLNVREITMGLRQTGLHENVDVQVNPIGPDVASIPRGHARIYLVHMHYVCVANVSGCLVFFDPLNQPFETYALPMPTPKTLRSVNMHVQPPSSSYCGNFVIFFLHVVYRTINPRCGAEKAISVVRSQLSQYLFTPPSPLQPNLMLIEHFSGQYKLGEEFFGASYRKFTAYDRDLSHAACRKHLYQVEFYRPTGRRSKE